MAHSNNLIWKEFNKGILCRCVGGAQGNQQRAVFLHCPWTSNGKDPLSPLSPTLRFEGWNGSGEMGTQIEQHGEATLAGAVAFTGRHSPPLPTTTSLSSSFQNSHQCLPLTKPTRSQRAREPTNEIHNVSAFQDRSTLEKAGKWIWGDKPEASGMRA